MPFAMSVAPSFQIGIAYLSISFLRCPHPSPASPILAVREIPGVYAGAKKRTAFHDHLFKCSCQWVLWGFHRFFAVFFGISPKLGKNPQIWRRNDAFSRRPTRAAVTS
jgi:xanthosine utilization system XapX-like protein